jgi:hypothetical protein
MNLRKENVMIDFVKLRIENSDHDEFLKNPLLDFKKSLSISTGEITGNMVAEYQGLKITIYVSGVTIIEGSLHKYSNNGEHNYNDFNRLHLTEVVKDLEKKFNLDLRNCTLVNLEVGANVIPVISSKDLLKYLFLHHRKDFRYGDFKNGTYKQASYREYYLKAYDKAQQYGLQNELFRFEVKMVTSRFINKLGVKSLEDLLIPNNLVIIGNFMLKCWRETLQWDPTISKYYLTGSAKDQLAKWSNPNYWSELAGDKKEYRNRFSREVKKYRHFQAHASENIQNQMERILYLKLIELMADPDLLKMAQENKPTVRNQPLTKKRDHTKESNLDDDW